MIDANRLDRDVLQRAEPLARLTSCLPSLSVTGWALFVFVLALVVRVIYAIVAARIDPFLVQNPLLGDAYSYDRIARTLLAGGGYGQAVGRPTTFWPPLYPFFLTAVYSAFGYDLTVARIAQAVVGAILPVTVFLIGHQLGRPRAARWASMGAAFYPHVIYFGAWLISESLYLALAGLLLLAAARMQVRPAVRQAVALAAVVGLAALAKPSVLMHLPLFAIWVLFCLVAIPLQRRILLGFAFALTLTAVLAPWTLRNYALLGQPVLISTNGGYTFYGANNEDAFGGHYEGFPLKIEGLNEAEEQTQYYILGLTWIRENPEQFAWLVSRKFSRLLSPLSVASWEEDYRLPGEWIVRPVYTLFLITAALGIILTLRQWRRFFLLYIPILGVCISTFVFYGDARYTLPAVPSLVLFSALTIDAIILRVGNVPSTLEDGASTSTMSAN